ncbi:helix-turn-helix domain-containing protein [Filimonas effusa]|uniref:XRE family transcriptional regulator n=1 Tax=Filimonas effusa TaxID=2508721 RepID=A0A4Q1D9I2_9BACT|nr:helix-turn-helix transcriptional regulator [Filimonas effusa]RXK86001.1 XRE family transcriptional regulator [Filimonas effusa]
MRKLNDNGRRALKVFGENMKKAREAKGLTARYFASTADIAYSQVWKLENGLVEPALTTLVAISKTLETSIDELVFGASG